MSSAAGQFVRVVVEQKGVDEKLAFTSPDGKPLVESNLTDIIGAPESLSYEATAAVTYQLAIRGNGPANQSGAYEARLEIKASATAQNRKQITADALLNGARQLTEREAYTLPSIGREIEPESPHCLVQDLVQHR